MMSASWEVWLTSSWGICGAHLLRFSVGLLMLGGGVVEGLDVPGCRDDSRHPGHP